MKDCGFNRKSRWEEFISGNELEGITPVQFSGIYSENIPSARGLEGQMYNNFRQGGMRCNWYAKFRKVYDANENEDFCASFYSYPSHLLRNVVQSMQSSVMQSTCIVN